MKSAVHYSLFGVHLSLDFTLLTVLEYRIECNNITKVEIF